LFISDIQLPEKIIFYEKVSGIPSSDGLEWSGSDGAGEYLISSTKPSIPLRPNSRDYVPVRRTNDHQRLDPVRRRQIMREARLNWQKKAMLKQGNKYYFRREIIMKQRSTIIRNRLRR
jgi:hypothetical protein